MARSLWAGLLPRRRASYFRVAPLAAALLLSVALPGARSRGETSAAPPPRSTGVELPVTKVPLAGEAAEAYFSPDGRSLVCNAKLPGDSKYHVYTFEVNGTDVRRINDRGDDACSFYFPDGRRLVWTSTRDWLSLPPGSYSDPADYPQGAEIYTSDLFGKEVKRITNNRAYDAEVSVSPDGQWVLFARQVDGRLDLYRMRPDGSDVFQITRTPDWQEGGAQWMPDGKSILFRAWKIQDQGQKPLPMTIFTIRPDGTGLVEVTHEPGTNWAPFPAPDGRHFTYVKVLPSRNFELFLGDLATGTSRQLTFNSAFDGFPAISPDGRWLSFTSTRGAQANDPGMHLYLMDISSLGVGPSVRGG